MTKHGVRPHRIGYQLPHAACETCRILVDRLQECKERLNKASSLMWSLVGTRKADDFEAVLRELESLRMECGIITEVKRHKAEHFRSYPN